MDEVSLLTAITLFLLSASSALVGVSVLQEGCIEGFRHGLNSADPWVSYHGVCSPHLIRAIRMCYFSVQKRSMS